MEIVTDKMPCTENLTLKFLLLMTGKIILFSIETILEKDNYTIVKANSGTAALKNIVEAA